MLSKLSLFSLLAAASVVSASPLLDAAARVTTLDKRDVTVTEADLDTFKYYIQMVQATACNGDTLPGAAITCSADACPAVEADSGKIINTFSGLVTGVDGFVGIDPVKKNIVVAVRSSHNIRNWITDLIFGFDKCDYVSGCKIHSGFSDAWDEVSETAIAAVQYAKSAYPDYNIISTGHSLGGAVATLAAADLRRMGYGVDLYTFGSPRVGNQAFVNYVSNQPGGEYRITHVDDPVPRLPPIFLGYRHTSPEFWLSTGNATTIDYTVADIKVCEGYANTTCNGGTGGLDIQAHYNYLAKTGACSSGGIQFRERETDISDEDLAVRLTTWAQMDMEQSKALGQA